MRNSTVSPFCSMLTHNSDATILGCVFGSSTNRVTPCTTLPGRATTLAAQTARTAAAQREATEAQPRAASAVERAQAALSPAGVAGSWWFTKTGAAVLAAQRDAAAQWARRAGRAGCCSRLVNHPPTPITGGDPL